jgi:dTDP-4-dehydrorhamnose 3,5-epimerase-like enzyme
VIDHIQVIPLQKFEDERGWLLELRRESRMPKPTKQTNVSFSRRGVIRGLHYHERGQDDLFVCLQGTARVVVLDLESGHGFEALTDLLFCYHVTEEYDPSDPDEHQVPWSDERVRHLWSTTSPILSKRDAADAS